jgi:hypothetical protein
VARSLRNYVDTLFYENVNDPPVRARIRSAGGFCRRHARLIRRQADALGSAIILRDILTNQLRALQSGQFDRPPETAGPISRLLDGSSREQQAASCHLCEEERKRDGLGVDSLLEGMGKAAFAALFEQSIGLCLPHFRLAFTRCQNQAIWDRVLQKERASLEQLGEELRELARKFDYRYQDEPRGGECDSWIQALSLTSGWPDE